jgi:microsomal dipeptidase-like Zn-dependent dipeptidase
MDRRSFIKYSLWGGLLLARYRNAWASEGTSSEGKGPSKKFIIWDAHAHPPGLFSDRPDPTMVTLSRIKQAGLKGCVLAAVGDYAVKGRSSMRGTSAKLETERQLDQILSWMKSANIKQIRSISDLAHLNTGATGVLLGIEGADALEGRLENLDFFYEKYGVRTITLMHDSTNAIGRHQRAPSTGEGLTPFGEKVVERMNQLGMIIDVAHADTQTLRGVTTLTEHPVIDSHTHLTVQKKPLSRQRSWEEMEWIAGTGGVICTWPLSHEGRTTLPDWAGEVKTIQFRLGLNHVGLGTDSGGHLPKTVEGYTHIGDLPQLISALEATGLQGEAIQAYLGGNFERVIRTVLR